MKNIANILTSIRILISVVIIIVQPLSAIFYILYLCCGISDILDGYIARKTNTANNKGAIYDSIADAIFLISILICVIPVLRIPAWLLWSVVSVTLVRIASYVIGFIKYRTFSSLHTYLNKFTGLLLFAVPIMFIVFEIELIGYILVSVSMVSALEELFIICKSKQLNRDVKCIFAS